MEDNKHQMGEILHDLMLRGYTSNKRIWKIGSTTPSRRVSDLREVFGKENLPSKRGRYGYLDFYLNPDIIETLRLKWIEFCEDYDSDAECKLRLWKWCLANKALFRK